MKWSIRTLLLCLVFTVTAVGLAQENDVYTYKEGDLNGIGKWYMDREIAAVMSYMGMGWLERNTREQEENTSRLLANMNLQPGDIVADIGAGSGYHAVKIAKKVPDGKVFAVDIQPEMLAAIEEKLKHTDIGNITTVPGGMKTVNLTPHSVDKVLMVDVYHEFEFPLEMMISIREALKPDGSVYLIEYRGEDNSIPIKRLHKMTEVQAVKEMRAAGFELVKNLKNLPIQHCMIFKKN